MHGARIVAEVVGNADMFGQWKQEMEMMAGRIKVGALWALCSMQGGPLHPCCHRILQLNYCQAAIGGDESTV